MNIDGDGELVLTFTGDVMLGQLVNEMLSVVSTNILPGLSYQV